MTRYLVRDVVRDVIATVAVNELFIVDALAVRDDGAVIRRLRGSARHDEQLGFGVDDLAVLATPVVWLALDEMATRLGSAAADGLIAAAKQRGRRVFRLRPRRVTLPAFTAEQLAELRTLIVRTADERGVDPERAQILADAVLARIVAPTPGSAAGDNDPAPE